VATARAVQASGKFIEAWSLEPDRVRAVPLTADDVHDSLGSQILVTSSPWTIAVVVSNTAPRSRSFPATMTWRVSQLAARLGLLVVLRTISGLARRFLSGNAGHATTTRAHHADRT
jgi:hypothetical protein